MPRLRNFPIVVGRSFTQPAAPPLVRSDEMVSG
jgi:hypothetical protein